MNVSPHSIRQFNKMSLVSDLDVLKNENIKAIVTPQDVENILLDYGFENAVIKELNGYDDKNFHIKVERLSEKNNAINICVDGYVLKFINRLDSQDIEFFNAQNSVLLYLGNRNICCPKPVITLEGQFLLVTKLSSGYHIVRLLEYIPGDILAQVECTPKLCYECGAFIANLNNILKTFKHKGFEDRNTPWMLKNVPMLIDFLFAVDDSNKQRLVKEVVHSFSSRVLPHLEKFETGLVHGDFNEQNILIEEKDGSWHVKGVLDFGDSHVACLWFDLAITMTYLIIQARDINSGGYVLAGYTSVRELAFEEIQLLKVAVCARLCQSLVLGAFTYSRNPENIYVTKTGIIGWSILEKLWHTSDEEITNRWLNVCKNFDPK